jgi:uncharacterized protein (DUF2235 family)
MGKNVALCFDGPANEFTRNKTNMVKFFFTLNTIPPGLRTMEAAGAPVRIGR